MKKNRIFKRKIDQSEEMMQLKINTKKNRPPAEFEFNAFKDAKEHFKEYKVLIIAGA